ncbi:MAG TPA: FkbM family methyltransferase [Solirubrobacteraceae bacterium]|jgi:FkbM family methyltransferase|nr:FkbM family methyltransferase [Solirubrobacteraceae bacterium]
MLGLNRSPLAAADLRGVAGLLDRPVVAVDVGCRDGVRRAWQQLGPHALLVGFDPDPAECARLNDAAADSARERYEPVALAAAEGEATLHLTADPQSSSLYPPDPRALRRYPELWRHEPRGTQTIVTSTIDSWARSAAIESIDALKVDVQGAELDVLRGAEQQLASVRVIEAEVEFQELYEGQPLFHDIDRFLRARGFRLWRLRDIYHCGLSRAGRGEPVFGVGEYVEHTRLGGQIAWANAVFVREELADAGTQVGWLTRARDACISSIFGFPELAELALREAAAIAPEPAKATLAGALARTRRRANRRRLDDLFRRAPAHARGFVEAHVLRR